MSKLKDSADINIDYVEPYQIHQKIIVRQSPMDEAAECDIAIRAERLEVHHNCLFKKPIDVSNGRLFVAPGIKANFEGGINITNTHIITSSPLAIQGVQIGNPSKWIITDKVFILRPEADATIVDDLSSSVESVKLNDALEVPVLGLVDSDVA